MVSPLALIDRLGARAGDSPHLLLAKRNVARGGAVMVPGVAVMLGECLLCRQELGVAICLVTILAHLTNLVLFGRSGNLGGYMRRIGPITLVTTALVRFGMRGIPMSEAIYFGALPWVLGAALGAHVRRLLAACASWVGMVALCELAVLRFPAPSVPGAALAATLFVLNGAVIVAVMCFVVFPLDLGRRELALALRHEHARSERLLLNVLPVEIAERLKDAPGTIADRFDHATVLFADIAGFTPMSAQLSPQELVATLDEIFSAFDDIAHRHQLEKIKTIGDAYMVVGGVPRPRADHAQAVALMALEMCELVAARRFAGGRDLALRIGVHTGEVVAGVIGKKKFSYDLWGDTVNTASRMESHSVPGGIQVSEATRAALGDGFVLEARGTIEVKGKGPMRTWWLKARAEAAPPGMPLTQSATP